MTTRSLSALALLTGVALLAGCGDAAGPPQAAPAKVSGKVVLADGKPAKDVKLTLVPTETGAQAVFRLGADGKFSGEMIPAKYLYYFDTIDGKEAALKGVPAVYHSPTNDHSVEVKGGDDLTITLK